MSYDGVLLSSDQSFIFVAIRNRLARTLTIDLHFHTKVKVHTEILVSFFYWYKVFGHKPMSNIEITSTLVNLSFIVSVQYQHMVPVLGTASFLMFIHFGLI